MRTTTTLLFGALSLASSALAHYNFEALIVNNNITSAYEFVRQTNNSNSPITNINSTDMVCNSGGLLAATKAQTSTYSVSPGDEVGFTVNAEIGHPGPLSVWMSKAPDGTTAQDYDGDGYWFKVYELTTSSITSDGLQWATYVNGGINNFTFALPSELPAGEYLMRAEHIALHGAGSYGGAQFFIGCAQLSVGGSGSGTPSPTTTIPGDYTGYESGILINIYYPVPTSYETPGPVTWPNACEDHTANYEGQTSDGDCTGSSSNSTSSGSSSGSSASASASASAVSSATTSVAAAGTASASKVASSAASVATASANAAGNAAATTTSASAAASATKSSGSCKKKRGLKANKVKKAKKAAMYA